MSCRPPRPSAATCAPATSGAIVAHHGADLPARVRARLDLRGARRRQRRRRRQARLPAARRAASGSSSSTARHAGSLALTDEGDGLGAVRWFVLDRALRGHGLGRRLIGELIDRGARRPATTGSGSRPSATCAPPPHLYRSHGFELVSARDRPALGPRASSPTSATSSASRRAPSPRARRAPARARGPSRSARRRRAAGGPVVDRALDQARAPRARAGAARAAGRRARGRSR